MVKTLIKIVVGLIIVNAAVRVGSSFWNYYRFEDALLQIAQFGDKRTERQLCDEAMTTAADYGVPIAPADLMIKKGSNPPFNCEAGATVLQSGPQGVGMVQITIEGQYLDQLQLFPGYSYPWEFKPSASARLRF